MHCKRKRNNDRLGGLASSRCELKSSAYSRDDVCLPVYPTDRAVSLNVNAAPIASDTPNLALACVAFQPAEFNETRRTLLSSTMIFDTKDTRRGITAPFALGLVARRPYGGLIIAGESMGISPMSRALSLRGSVLAARTGANCGWL